MEINQIKAYLRSPFGIKDQFSENKIGLQYNVYGRRATSQMLRSDRLALEVERG